MKKIISQISLILLIIMLGFASTLITEVYAESLAGINCPAKVNEGDVFTVSLIFPSGYEVTAAQANVTVKYSDNSTKTERIVYTVDKDLNLTVDAPAKFTAKVAGTAQISITNILMSKTDGTTVESNGSKTTTITVVAKTSDTGSSNGGSTSGNTSSGNTTGSSSGSNSGSSSSGNASSGNASGNTSGNSSSSGNTGTTTAPKFTDVNETVYTTTRCNLRESYSTSSNKVAVVNEGTKLTRKGVGDNGWSKCEYNGKTVYVSSQYLTTTAPKDAEDDKPEEKEPEEVKFKDTKENLYAKQSCNLRASWSTDSEKVGYLEKGQAVERTGYAENGWSRILYNGKTVYVASRLLVVEKPEEDEKDENTVTNEVVNETPIDGTLINEEIEKLTEEEMLNIIKEEVGVLPEVGTNVANVAYVIVTFMVLCGLACGIIYIKKIK